MSDEFPIAVPSALEVLRICRDGGYRIASGDWVDLTDQLSASLAGTRLFTPHELDEARARAVESGAAPSVRVVDRSSQEACFELAREGPVVVLNFASAVNPGGGFLGGARAQEEDLCRCSGLFPTLLTQPLYYEANRSLRSALYTDHIIFSPKVPFFRVDSEGPLCDQPWPCSVITAPAPNRGALRPEEAEDTQALRETFRRRWGKLLAVARAMGERKLVLGAWGCGAFGNDPGMVAETAHEVLSTEEFRGALDRVVFAIPSRWRRSEKNLTAFRRVFEEGPQQESEP